MLYEHPGCARGQLCGMVLGVVPLCRVFYFRVRWDGGKEEGKKAGFFLLLIPEIDDLPIEVFITSCSLVLGIMLLNPFSCP